MISLLLLQSSVSIKSPLGAFGELLLESHFVFGQAPRGQRGRAVVHNAHQTS